MYVRQTCAPHRWPTSLSRAHPSRSAPPLLGQLGRVAANPRRIPRAWGGQGIFGQGILIVPEKKMVIAVVSNWPKASGADLRVPQLQFFQKLAMAAD